MLYPGTLNHHQGIDIAIRAFASIKDVVPQVDFHVYGEGSDKANLDKLIGELSLQERVVIREPVPLIEVPGLIENADLGGAEAKGLLCQRGF